MNFLILNSLISGAGIVTLLLLHDAPNRLKMYFATVMILFWYLPLPLFSFEWGNASDPIQVLAIHDTIRAVAAPTTTGIPLMTSVFAIATGLGLFWFIADVLRERRQTVEMMARSQDGSWIWQQLPTAISEPSIPIRILEKENGAMVSGWFKPVIWIGKAHVSGQELTGLICHELAHIRHRDNFWLLAILFSERLFWWNPFVRLLGHKARFYMEMGCDEYCSRMIDPKEYQTSLARTLLQSIEFVQAPLAVRVHHATSTNMIRIKSIERSFQMKHKHVLAFLAMTAFTLLLFARPNNDRIYRINQLNDEYGALPEFTKKVAPDYPKAAISEKIECYVILEVVLRKDGTMDTFKVLKDYRDEQYGFGHSAIKAVKKWEFEPAKLDGEAVDVRMTLKIDFVLE